MAIGLTAVDGVYAGLSVCRSVSFLLLVWEMLDGFIRRPDANCNSSTSLFAFKLNSFFLVSLPLFRCNHTE